MEGLSLPKDVDSMSLPQKGLALFLLGGALYALYFLLPPLVFILQNLYFAIGLAIPLVLAAFNWELLWMIFKTISEKTTNWIIGLSPLDVMDRYLDWLGKKITTITKAKVDLMATLVDVKSQIQEKEQSYKKNMEKAVAYESSAPVESGISAGNALSDQEFLTTLIPLRNNVEEKVNYLAELEEVMQSSKKQLAYKIDNLKLQYKTLKSTEKGMRSANDVIGGAGGMTKMFEESIKQTKSQMNKMTANIQNFENNIKPVLNSARLDKQLHQGAAQQLLEDFKRTNVALTAQVQIGKSKELVRR